LRLEPRYHEAWNNRGVALTKIGHIRPALRCFERAIQINPKYFEARGNQGLAFEQAGFLDSAIHCYYKFLELAPDSKIKLARATGRHIQSLLRKIHSMNLDLPLAES